MQWASTHEQKQNYTGRKNNSLLSISVQYLSPLQNGRILDKSKLKAIAGNRINIGKMVRFAFDRIENIVGKRFLLRVIKTRHSLVKV